MNGSQSGCLRRWVFAPRPRGDAVTDGAVSGPTSSPSAGWGHAPALCRSPLPGSLTHLPSLLRPLHLL